MFASISDPDSAAIAAIELFGAEAATAVTYCAFKIDQTIEKKTTSFCSRTFCRLTGLPSKGDAH